MRRRGFLFLLVALLGLLLSSAPLPAQLRVQPVAEHSDLESLQLTLRKLDSSATFMQMTAHPDDEDNALLAMLGHGQGMRTVLVTATRGDGGQNEIGPELFQALGVLRTEELLAAHRFDGAEQFFTRAVDFGYSFSVEETLQKWGHEEILGDFVRLIRAIRPDVIVGFLCGGEGGGQHHQAAARLTREAFRAAADPARFPDQIREGLRPWQALRVFCTDFSSFGPRAGVQGPDLLSVSYDVFEPLLGRTFGEIGIEARSMHKCQGTSQLLPLPGASVARTYRLQDSTVDEPGIAPEALFDGIDTTLGGLSRFADPRPPEPLTSALRIIGQRVADARRAVQVQGAVAAAPPLAAGLGYLRDLRVRLPRLGLSLQAEKEIDDRLAQKERQFQQALAIASGLRLEALADDGLVTAGQRVRISVRGSNRGAAAVEVDRVAFSGFEGQPAPCTATLEPSGVLKCDADLRVANAPLSTAYWTPRQDAARYDFEADVPFGLPFRPSPFRVAFHLSVAGAPIVVDRVVAFRYDDVMAGEKRMELKVVPPFAARVSPAVAVIPRADSAAGKDREIEVAVSSNEKTAVAARVTLTAPQGWRVEPASAALTFTREDEATTVKFRVTPTREAPSGKYVVSATVEGTSGGSPRTSSVGYEVIEYPHIHRQHLVVPASTRVTIVDVTLPPGLQVGYVMGVGDQVPQAIEQLGAAVEMIGPAQLAAGDLSRYDVIVTGVRAYERRPDLRASNHRLIQYAENGGTVLVQYNKFEFNQAQYGPYPAKVSANRVTDENAPVDVLVPEHPVFNTPNRIAADAWNGWVQERGLYFLGDRDPRYVDLVSATDPFEYNPGVKTGALVEARVGKGRWIYIGLGLWRQLPAGTDGAYRLMANLLSLGRSK